MSAKKKEAAPEAEAPKEGAEGAEGEAAPKKGKKKLIFIAGGGLLVVIIVAVVLLMGGSKKPAEGEEEAAVTEEEHGEADAGGHGGGHGEEAADSGHGGGHGEKAKPVKGGPVYYELPGFLVNLNSSTSKVSFLKMSVTLELKDADAVATMDANKPRIIDTFNTYLRELRPTDIQGSAGIYRLRDELISRLNSTIEEGLVKDILFGEIIVQ